MATEDTANINCVERRELAVKVVCVGDSGVGKTKLVERFISGDYKPHQLPTHALDLFQYLAIVDDEPVNVAFWDTAGQEIFKSLRPAEYLNAHACIMVFDVTKKRTYMNLNTWYEELRQYRSQIPVLCAANKIDATMEETEKLFPMNHNIPLYSVSAINGTNVEKMFLDAIQSAVKYKKSSLDFNDLVLKGLANMGKTILFMFGIFLHIIQFSRTSLCSEIGGE